MIGETYLQPQSLGNAPAVTCAAATSIEILDDGFFFLHCHRV